MLNRVGKKTKIAREIYQHFTPHELYIELFFGGGGMFFAKPPAKYNILNDIDDDVFNLFMLVKETPQTLYEAIELMPINASLLKFWQKNKETTPINKALRFLLLSNFTYLGMGGTLRLGIGNDKNLLLSNIKSVHKKITDAQTTCYDFRDVLQKVAFRHEREKQRTFVYADPPYLTTNNNYAANAFTETDIKDLFEMLINSGFNFAISEFDNQIVLDLVKLHNLYVTVIGERRTLKNRNTEILITNYPTQVEQQILF
jgi:DNA adenine methylase